MQFSPWLSAKYCFRTTSKSFLIQARIHARPQSPLPSKQCAALLLPEHVYTSAIRQLKTKFTHPLMIGGVMEQFAPILLLIVLVISILVRRRISLRFATRVAIGSTLGFVIAIIGFLLLDQVVDPTALKGTRVIGWALGLTMVRSFLAIPFAVSGYVSSRLGKTK